MQCDWSSRKQRNAFLSYQTNKFRGPIQSRCSFKSRDVVDYRVADVPQGLAPLPTNVSKAGLILRILTWLGFSPFLFFRPIYTVS